MALGQALQDKLEIRCIQVTQDGDMERRNEGVLR